MRLTVGISTVADNLPRLEAVFRSIAAVRPASELNLDALVVVQGIEGPTGAGEEAPTTAGPPISTDLRIPQAIQSALPDNVPLTVVSMPGYGLSRSRNALLDGFRGDFLHICDDDVRLPPEYAEALSRILNDHDAEFYSFMARRPDGTPIKPYPSGNFYHTPRTIFSVSSVEIVVSARVREMGVSFDERFGLGSRWPTGEEIVFLSAVLKRGGVGRFVPETVLQVEYDVSRHFEERPFVSKGALLCRVYGRFAALVLIPLFAFRKRRTYGAGFVRLVRYFYRGMREFIASGR